MTARPHATARRLQTIALRAAGVSFSATTNPSTVVLRAKVEGHAERLAATTAAQDALAAEGFLVRYMPGAGRLVVLV